jgi:PII-like signaling protein
MMTHRELTGEQTLLRIFVGEGDRRGREPLHEALLERARELGLAGCTSMKAAMGFGADGHVHSDFPPDYAVDLPIVVELVDTRDNVETFLNDVEPWLGDALVTSERLRVHRYA